MRQNASDGDDALFPAGSIYPWSSGTSHSTPGIAGYTSLITDFRNNSEAIFLAPGPSGSASITINATSIAGDGVPGNADETVQDFALIAYNFSTTISDGVVGFGSGAYGCTSTVGFVVSDSDLSGGVSFGVSVTTTGGDSETCDDGGTMPGDGCDAVCQVESV